MAAAAIAAIAEGAMDPEAIGREKLRRYKMIEPIGKGAFAEVFKHEDLMVTAAIEANKAAGGTGGSSGDSSNSQGLAPASQSYGGRPRFVAIKRILKDSYKAGVNLGAIKELQTLGEISSLGIPAPLSRHPNILQLLDAFVYGGRVHLVLEYGLVDLSALIRDSRVTLTEAHIKGIMKQLLTGLVHLHTGASGGAVHLHRDLKPDNVLFAADGTLKIADFGHATRAPEPEEFGPPSASEDAGMVNGGRRLFHRVFTVWYRAPELLLGSKAYGPSADMWAIGCILAELLLRQPLFPGDGTELNQWQQIVRLLGTPLDPLAPSSSGSGNGSGGADTGPIDPSLLLSSRSSTLNHSIAAATCSDRARPLLKQLVATNPDLFQTDFKSKAQQPSAAAGAASSSSFSSMIGASGQSYSHDPTWPACSSLPGYPAWQLEKRAPQPWELIFDKIADNKAPSEPLLHLIGGLLCYEPSRRLSAIEALNHHWFSIQPSPSTPDRLPFPPHVREVIAKTMAGVV